MRDGYLTVRGRWPSSAFLLALHRFEIHKETCAPILRRVGRDVAHVLLRASVALRQRHLERLVERGLQLRLRERVDAQRAVEDSAETAELGEDENAGRALGEVARDNVLEGPDVDSLA